MKITKKFFKQLQENLSIIDNLAENEVEETLAEIIKIANSYYYNKNESLLSDDLYDLIRDKLMKINPNNDVFKEVGAKIETKTKKKLPYWMGSMDKIKADEKVLERWLKKYTGDYVLSDKLDGISAMVHIKNGKMSLYTRGDGAFGMDISRMINHIQNIPKDITEDISVRGELILSKANWEKNKDKGANPRNLVSGIFNCKKPNLDLLKTVDFVAYQLLYPTNVLPSIQFDNLTKLGFTIANHSIINQGGLDINVLSNYLNNRRTLSKYEIDGIVVNLNIEGDNIESGNPKTGFAFKNIITNDSAEIIVTDIEWNISKDGLIKPVILFPSINIGGVQVQRATGFNAKFIKDNVIGIGSKIIIIRSGDVIPHITTILKESNTGEPMLPKNIPYEWNKSGVDIIATENSEELEKKILINFFEKMKVKGVSSGIIKKLYDSNFNTIFKILKITIPELLTIDGIKQKSAQNIYNALQEITLDNCLTLMVASNVFGRGFGEKKIKMILDNLPNSSSLFETTPTLQNLINIKGINEITALQFLDSINKFKSFLQTNHLTCNITQQQVQTKKKSNKQQNLLNIAILFTGFRDKDLETDIISRGGEIKSVLNKTVNILIVKDDETENKKTEKAVELGIEILSKEGFIKKYLI